MTYRKSWLRKRTDRTRRSHPPLRVRAAALRPRFGGRARGSPAGEPPGRVPASQGAENGGLGDRQTGRRAPRLLHRSGGPRRTAALARPVLGRCSRGVQKRSGKAQESRRREEAVNRTISIAPVRKTIVVQATPESAFAEFTAGLDRWWPKTHN